MAWTMQQFVLFVGYTATLSGIEKTPGDMLAEKNGRLRTVLR